jgi:HlyD family secretion protein
MKARALRAALLITGFAGLALATLAMARCPHPAEVWQGQMEATEVDVAAKIAARVATLPVAEGQRVKRGDVVVTFDSPELRARADQAEAGQRAASAQSDKAQHGAREEEVRQALAAWDRARHAAALARVTYERIERLERDGVVSVQRRDEAEAQWRTAEDAAAAAQAGHEMAASGARVEDKATASAMADRARGAVAEVDAFLAEIELTAPIDGEVARRNVEPGELVGAGAPVVTLVDLADCWAVFQVREDRLSGLRMGDRFRARVPALGREIELVVSYLAPLGDFATWRPTSQSGGFDLKTFEVRARPTAAVEGLRPGMSVLVERR